VRKDPSPVHVIVTQPRRIAGSQASYSGREELALPRTLSSAPGEWPPEFLLVYRPTAFCRLCV